MDRSVSSQPLFAGPGRILCAQRLNAARFFAMFLFWTEDLAGWLSRCDCEVAPSAHRVVRGRHVHPGRCFFGSKLRGFVFNTNPSAPRIGLPQNLPCQVPTPTRGGSLRALLNKEKCSIFSLKLPSTLACEVAYAHGHAAMLARETRMQRSPYLGSQPTLEHASAEHSTN
jgi:hypothetical protein